MFTRPLSAYLLLAMLSIVFLGPVFLVERARAQTVNWRNNLDAAKVEASRTGKLVLLHFYTSRCGPCKKLERDVFSQPQIAVALERDYVPVKFNRDESPAIANAFQITQVPSEVVLNGHGNFIQKLSCPLEPNAYGEQLANVAQHYRQRTPDRTPTEQARVNSAYAGLKIGQTNNAPTATAAPPTGNAPIAPAVTKNPYVFAAPPAVKQQPSAAAVPANAMPNSYRNRYVAAAPQNPALQNPDVTQAPIGQVRATAPATPPIVAAPPAAVPPPIAKQVTPPEISSPAMPQVAAAPQPAMRQAAAAPESVIEAWPPKLPAGVPPLAFDGYCPVTLKHAKKWMRGDKSIGAISRGRTYLFVGEQQRQQFLADYDAYSPVFSGNDPVKILDENEEVAGSREFGFEFRGAFYLFASKETMARFASQPDRYSAEVRQAMKRMDAAGGGTIRR